MPAPQAIGVQAADENTGGTTSILAAARRPLKPADRRPFVVRWRCLVLSEVGPSGPHTRLVLVALAKWMSPDGGSCWPSTITLAEATALSRRVVGLHLRRAVDEGWIVRRRRGAGRANRGYTYQATFPPEIES